MRGCGLGPAWFVGVSQGTPKCQVPRVKEGPWVGVEGWRLGSAQQEGGSEDRGLGPGAQQAPRCPSGQGKSWPYFLPFLRHPSGSPRCCWASNCGWVPLGVGTPPLHQLPLRGASPVGLAFTLPLPSLPLTPSGQAWLEGGSVGRGSGPGSQQAPRGPSGQGKRWPPSFLILCPPNGPPLSPSRRGIPSPPPAAL